MFKLVAVIFAMVNGAPVEPPVRVLTYNETFETQEACMAFAKSDEGLVLRQTVNEYVMAQHGAIVARIGCMQAEDDTI